MSIKYFCDDCDKELKFDGFAEESESVEIYYKNRYVNGLCYPHCSTAKKFAELTNQKTLSRSSLGIIKSLGYKIVDVSPYDEW